MKTVPHPPKSRRLLCILLSLIAGSALWLFPAVIAKNSIYLNLDRLAKHEFSGTLTKSKSALPSVGRAGYFEVTAESGRVIRAACIGKQNIATANCRNFLNAYEGKDITAFFVDELYTHETAMPRIVSATDSEGQTILSETYAKEIFWSELMLAGVAWGAMNILFGGVLLWAHQPQTSQK